jgi:hypothetical protein
LMFSVICITLIAWLIVGSNFFMARIGVYLLIHVLGVAKSFGKLNMLNVGFAPRSASRKTVEVFFQSSILKRRNIAANAPRLKHAAILEKMLHGEMGYKHGA